MSIKVFRKTNKGLLDALDDASIVCEYCGESLFYSGICCKQRARKYKDGRLKKFAYKESKAKKTGQ